jgi:hypothetical protein
MQKNFLKSLYQTINLLKIAHHRLSKYTMPIKNMHKMNQYKPQINK